MKLFFSFLILHLSLLACAQDRRDTLVQNALLWEISGNDLRAPSYMYGTIHLACATDIELPEILINKLLSSKIFFIETLCRKGAVDSGLLNSKSDKSLNKQLGNRCYKQGKKLLESYYGSIDDDYLNSLPTVAVMEKLTEASLRCKVISYDDTLYNIAKNNNLRLRGLETLEDLKHSVAPGIKLIPTREIIYDYIQRNEKHATEYQKHMNYYRNHDINWLYAEAAYTRNGDETSYKRKYIDQRNKSWIVLMEVSMKEAASFFAFGCAHLAGRNGIISLLRQKGYTVTPVY